ncbi:MAG: nicotinate-nucleotide adenylyltransferase [Gammaproteobacteria bacterium]|nr:nicotinate-nucleotide adenylyltransferase [Gammaproteobacteria bacterium]
MKRAIGVLGGTFDPIHLGHLRSALDIAQDLKLAKVYLMPNHTPPHKKQPQASNEQRLTMLKLATEHCAQLTIDTRELDCDGLSYSVLALESLRQEHPDTPLCFLMGMDSLLTLTRWHRWQDLLTLSHIIVSQRPGWPLPQTGEIANLLSQHRCIDANELNQNLAGKIMVYHAHPLAISSSQIRALIKNKKDPQFLLPDPVIRYIRQQSLYET